MIVSFLAGMKGAEFEVMKCMKDVRDHVVLGYVSDCVSC